MAKRPVGLTRHAGEIVLRDGIAHERSDHIDRHLGIGAPRKARDRLAVERRPAFRHVEATVAGETREQHIDEAEWRSFAPGGNVTHGPLSLLAALASQVALPGRRARTIHRLNY